MSIVPHGFILSMIWTAVYGNILTETVREIETRAFSNDTDCKVNIGRYLIRCDVEPKNDTVPTGSFCSFINKKDFHLEPDILLCDHGFLVYTYHNRKGTYHTQISSNHVISKRFWWIVAAVAVSVVYTGVAVTAIVCHYYCQREEGSNGGYTVQNRPPYITCPTVPEQIADKSKHTVIVTWEEPTATDPDGDDVTISQSGGDKGVSGDSFPEKSYVMEYEAKDEYGGSDKCTITFTVKVIPCNNTPYVANGRANCDSNPYIYGTRCNIKCNDGYELPPNSVSVINCDKNGRTGKWVPDHEDIECKKKKCKPPRRLCNGDFSCSSTEYEFDSVCNPSCNTGYSTNQTQNYIKCNGNDWTGSVHACKDVQSPVFKQCPNNINQFAEKGKREAVVTWSNPTADDNSIKRDPCETTSGVMVTQVSGGLPGSSFEVGYHEIHYTAVDSSNNEGQCRFVVIVKELSCDPLLVDDQFLIVKCPSGYLYGSTCLFSCFLSYQLVGDTTVTCEKDPKDEIKTFWDWTNNTESYCEKLACPVLPAPDGGALACSEALGNQICTMSCSDKYRVAKGTPTEYVCNDEQVWIQGIPPNCTDYVHPSNAYQPGELFYYYSGNCSDTNVQDSIKQNFVDTMKNLEGTDGWKNICPEYCTIEGVTVSCGPLNGRRRRELLFSHTIVKRSPNAFTLTFKISSEWEISKNLMENENKLTALSNLLKNEVSDGKLDIAGVSTGIVSMGWTELSCPIGQEPIYDSNGGCVGCPPGKYLKDGDCKDCEKGYIQEKEYQSYCTLCPHKTSTVKSGSTSSNDCLDMCPPGQFSSTGLVPCTPCPVGHYQSNYGSKSCKPCQAPTFTVTTGLTKSNDCNLMDFTFTTKDAFMKLPILPKKISNYSFGFYIKCPDRQDHSATVSLSNFNIIIGSQVNLTLSGHSIAVLLDPTTWIHVGLTWEASTKTAQIYGNGQMVASHIYNLVSESEIEIPAGSRMDIVPFQTGCSFTGFFLTDDVLDQEAIADVQESCVPPVQNALYTMNSIFTSERNGTELFNSKCDALDECKSNPCGNNNMCINKIDAYECVCNGGYSGSNCEIPPDFCVTHSCVHGAACLSHFSNYTCQCSEEYTGVFCEHKIVNGNWGKWSVWSDCSASCNGGIYTRRRYCNNPSPDPDGSHCLGSNTSQEACNTEICPECPSYFTIRQFKNSFNCSSEDNMVSCTVTCLPGYVFVKNHSPLDLYECGPGTGFDWPAKPPPCSRSHTPRSVRSATVVRYDINCDDEAPMMVGLSKNLNDLQCVKNNTCSIKTNIVSCSTSTRDRRSVESKDITIELSSSLPEESDFDLEDLFVNKIISPGLAALMNAYIDSAMSIEQMNTTDVLTVELDGTMYEADMSSLRVSTSIDCPNGTTKQELVCVACPFGTFWNDGVCEACLKGSFQDEDGQMQCKRCPVGYTTLYKASKEMSECSVPTGNAAEETSKILPEANKLNYGLVVAVPVAVVLLLVVIVTGILIIYRKNIRKKERYVGSILKGSVASLNMVRPSVNKGDDVPMEMENATPIKQCLRH